MHGAAFELAYVEQVLVPTLKPGDIVVRTRLTYPPSNPSPCATAIEVAAAELRFLIRTFCSPDFNPIEMAFSKLKAFHKNNRRPNRR